MKVSDEFINLLFDEIFVVKEKQNSVQFNYYGNNTARALHIVDFEMLGTENKDEQGKLQLKEEELGATNSEISRIKSEVAAKTDAVAAHELKVKALSQDVERPEVTTYGSLLWDSLMRSMPGDGKATVTRYQGLGKAKQ